MQLVFVHRHGIIEVSPDRPLDAGKSQLLRVSSDTTVHRSPEMQTSNKMDKCAIYLALHLRIKGELIAIRLMSIDTR